MYGSKTFITLFSTSFKWDFVWFMETHLLNEPLQLIGELAEVAGGDESQPALLQTVPGQLDYLVVGKAEHAICQREDALWRVAPDDVLNPFLHLSRGLREEGDGVTLA